MFPFGRHDNQLHLFQTLKGVVGMLRDPEHTESVFDIEDGLRDVAATEAMVAHLRQQPAVAAAIDARWLPTAPLDPAALARLPAGSLGHTFARHILDHGFDPDYYRHTSVACDRDWVLMRVRQTHDIWHCITGFGVDRIGELSLKAFELAQLRRPMAAVLCAGGVLRYLLKEPDQLAPLLHGIATGYRLGLHARPLLPVRWELDWERPVAAFRGELQIDLDAAEAPRLRFGP